jgi:hypothetical protein
MNPKDTLHNVATQVQKFEQKVVSKVTELEHAVEKPIEQIGAKTLFLGSTSGYLSGVALAKSGLTSLSAIKNQVHGKDHTLAKVWLSSVGTGFLCYGTASLAGLMNVNAMVGFIC